MNTPEYYMGKDCKRGHKSKRYARNGMCVECEQTRVAGWQQNRDRLEYNGYQRGYSAHSLYHLRRLLTKKNETIFCLRPSKRKKVIDATPRWVDVESLRGKYIDCLNASDGMNFHFVVDHIVPISNPKVCGLHVPDNLQVVSKSLNNLKGNKFNAIMAERDLMKWLSDAGKLSSSANEGVLGLHPQQPLPPE